MPVSEIEKKRHVITCPHCSGTETDRIPRGKFVKTMVGWLNVKHYICYTCKHTFYKLSS